MRHITRPDGKPWPKDRDFTPEEVREILALAKAAFTADDLAEYLNYEGGIPAEEVLQELEEIVRKREAGQP